MYGTFACLIALPGHAILAALFKRTSRVFQHGSDEPIMADVVRASFGCGSQILDVDALHASADDLPLAASSWQLTVKDREVVRSRSANTLRGRHRDELRTLGTERLVCWRCVMRVSGSTWISSSAKAQRMIDNLDRQLEQHGRQMQNQLTGELKKYFDPQDGHFPQRVERLVRRDGELEEVLRRQIGGEAVGVGQDTRRACRPENSPLLKVLSTDESQGVLAALRQMVERQLQSQRESPVESSNSRWTKKARR